MTFWAQLPGGGEMLLGQPLEAELLREADAPAHQLTAVFPAERPWQELAAVRAVHQGEVVFGGPVDEQNTRLTEDGLRVELVCRSWEALLLDNEAQPGLLRSPSLEGLWEKYLLPLGFAGVEGDKGPFSGELAVEKGQSCWQVLAAFCGEYLGAAPWVDGDRVVHCLAPASLQVEAGPVTGAELSLLPCKRLSAVWQQSYRGGYDTPFRPEEEPPWPRQRYVSVEEGRDPRALVAAGERQSRRLTVECPGLLWPAPGALVSGGAGPLGRFAGWTPVSLRWQLDGAGQRTTLAMEGGELSCG